MDDGSCNDLVTVESCLERKAIFDRSQTYCEWTGNAYGEFCRYADPVFSLKVCKIDQFVTWSL